MSFTPVTDANAEEAIRVLSEAFRDDPVINWTCNEPARLDPFFRLTLPIFIPHQLTYLDPQGRGAAAWLGPGQKLRWPYSLATVMRVLRLGGLTGARRMLVSSMKVEEHHPKTPHYYLFAIGVTPGHKGQGIGTALLSQVLRRCDADGVPAYLENSKAENLAFYQGHGFTVQRQIRFAPTAPPLWLMWREPQSVLRTRGSD